MSLLMTNINNFSFVNTYIKPELSAIDIDIDNIIIYNNNSDITLDIKCDVYSMILKKDYENLQKYANSNYLQTNAKRQTPLMLACKLGDIEAVKILLNEVGHISLNYKTAIDYAVENGNADVINLLIKYEKLPIFAHDAKHDNKFEQQTKKI